MKSNKKQLIFLGLVVFSGQIVQAKPNRSSSSSENTRELMRPVESTGLALPQFSTGFNASLDLKGIGFVSIVAPKEFATTQELNAARQEYIKLTRLKDVRSMSKEQCVVAYSKALELAKYDDALFYLKHLMTTVEDKKELQKFACQKADIYFAMKQFNKAAQSYQAYLDMYPGANDSESAHFHYIVALNTQKPRYDQDQEVTHKIIRSAEKYILEPTYKKYAQQVKSIHHACYDTLYQSEKSILDFYIKQNKPVAAEGRYAYLKQKYYEDFPQHRAEILAYGCDVAQLQGNKQLYQERLAYLGKQFPTERLAYKDKGKSFLTVM